MTTVPSVNATNPVSEAEVLRDALGLLKDREEVAERLLLSSAKHSFDPDKELDWDAPFEEGKWFWPPELVSLYGTPMWRKMSEEQRIALSQHEAAALASSASGSRSSSCSCSYGTSTTRPRPARTSATR